MKRLACLFALLPCLALAQIDYSLNVDVPAKSITVSIRLEKADATQEFRIPYWCPGFYFIQNYQRKISDVVATDAEGNTLRIHRPDERAWLVQNPKGGPIRLTYRVLGDDGGLGFFCVSVRDRAAFVNGAAAFMYPEGRLDEPCRLSIGKLPTKWEIATPMDPKGDKWEAAGYDEFIDHPIQMGLLERRKFEVEEIPFEAVFVRSERDMRCDPDAETARLKQVAAPAIRMFGGAPFKRYLFIIHLDPGNFDGGLEHRACNVINTADSRPLMIDDLAAHEYFHAWNVKQIRPKVLGPFDYTGPVRTANLWFSEGVTDYYAYRSTYRAGLQSEEWMLENYAFQIAELQNSKKRLSKTIEQVSRGAWETGGFGDGDYSYYTKGSICGLVFDAAIRGATEGKKSLDDVMRFLYAEHKLPKPGFAEDGLLKAINQVSGHDFTALYKQMIQSTQDMPYTYLSELGLRLQVPGNAYLSYGFQRRGPEVTEVSGELLSEGLRQGDRITKVNGQPYRDDSFVGLRPEDPVHLVLERDGGEFEFTVKAQMVPAQGYRLERDPFANATRLKRLAEWLEK